VLAEFPEPEPPRPFVSFQPHAAANGLAFSHDERFGFVGDAFVALFGDLAPLTTARLAAPVGFKVVRVDMQERRVVDFAVNSYAGPASQLPHQGFERPSHCAFGPDGALYVVDFGKISIAPEAGGVRMPDGAGALWRIWRSADATGQAPPQPEKPPVYLAQAGLIAVALAAMAIAAVAGAVYWLLSRRR
jgi:glucose/arabinose dehydrogenase